MNRARCVVISCMVALLTQGGMVTEALAVAGKRPPNILIMITDDQRFDGLGVVQAELGDRARFSFLNTPRLDALAAEGMRFRNAFVTTSLCSPSRAGMLTGQYGHANGIIDNVTPFSPRPTWATALQAAGYTTAYIGKWHHGEEQWERPGFDYIATFPGQGNYNDTTFRVSNEWWPTKTKGYVDARSTDFAIDFLEDRPREKPFAMVIGFKAVHQPFTPMMEDTQKYTSEIILDSPNWTAQPPWSQLKKPILWQRPAPPTEEHKNYLQTMEGVDRNVGRILDSLKELNLDKDTMVIFTSDNGFHFQDRRIGGDKRSAYEESIRVPMFVRWPGVIAPDSVSDAMVLNIDLAPTILDVAQLAIPATMQGRSLRPLFGADPEVWRDAFLYEYWQENTWWDSSREPRVPTILAVRTPRYKLITYPDYSKWTELFDLEVDPNEKHNLVGYASAIKSHIEMCNLLNELLDETDYIARPSVDTWLIGVTNSNATYQAHARLPATSRRPPLLIPNC